MMDAPSANPEACQRASVHPTHSCLHGLPTSRPNLASPPPPQFWGPPPPALTLSSVGPSPVLYHKFSFVGVSTVPLVSKPAVGYQALVPERRRSDLQAIHKTVTCPQTVCWPDLAMFGSPPTTGAAGTSSGKGVLRRAGGFLGALRENQHPTHTQGPGINRESSTVGLPAHDWLAGRKFWNNRAAHTEGNYEGKPAIQKNGVRNETQSQPRWKWRELSSKVSACESCVLGMEGERVDSVPDLSHLTEQEQSTILQVLQRDLELRRRDEGRVRILQQTGTDPARLRLLSGSWFSEECSKRHHNRVSGCELVHATIRCRRVKSRDVPLTELFNGEMEEPTNNNNTSPEAERRLKDGKYEENDGSSGSLTPTPTPRTKRPVAQGLQHTSSSSSSKDCERRSNGHSEEPE
ncbi:synaptotagmin-like protein 1 isoform X1, partial [Lates japonicus]